MQKIKRAIDELDNYTRNLLLDVLPSDLTEAQQTMVEVIGMDNFIEFCLRSKGGSSFYIPKLQNLIKYPIYRRIQEEYDGTNVRILAKKYDVSEATVYNVIKNKTMRGIL